MSFPLILGTAQLGMPYGVANVTGQPDQPTADAIVATALAGGVCYFDTATAYGSSERTLGNALESCHAQELAHVITKLPPVLPESPFELETCVHASLEALRVSHVYCIMLHRQEHLPALDGEYGVVLDGIIAQGLAQRIGISVYYPDAALAALRHPCINVIQVPSSLFDRRFLQTDFFSQAHESGKEIHVRSVFLQGVLCTPHNRLPQKLHSLAPYVLHLENICQTFACTQTEAALAWILRTLPQCHIIVGAETPAQLAELLAYADRASTMPAGLDEALATLFPPQDMDAINPARWRRIL